MFIYAHCFEISEYAYMISMNLQELYSCNIKYALTSSVVLEIFLFRLMQSFSFQLTVCLSFRFFFDFIEHERIEVILICPSSEQTLSKKKTHNSKERITSFLLFAESSSFEFFFSYSSSEEICGPFFFLLMLANCYSEFVFTFG